MAQGASMSDLGARNELVVLEAIRGAHEGSSQSEVMRRTGLSRQAVSLITRRLLERGLIETAGTRGVGRGKPRTVLRVVPSALLAAGVHLDPAGISVVIVDLDAQVVAERTLPPPGNDPLDDIRRIAAGLESLLEDLRRHGWSTADGRDAAEALLGIGVASPGALDAVAGVVLNPPWLPGWRNVPLVAELSAASGRPVVLDKDTTAALTAELWAGGRRAEEAATADGAAGEGTTLYVYVGAGIGSAVAARGRVHAGSTTQAGEIGHLPTGLPGELCQCGRLACLSTFTDVAGMLSRAGDAGPAEQNDRTGSPGPGTPSDPVGPSSTSARLAALAHRATGSAGTTPDTLAREQIEAHGTALGEALRSLIWVHDPCLVLIGGPYWRILEPLAMPRVRERALPDAGVPERVVLRSSTFGDDAAAIGAATLYLEHELSPAAR